MNDQECQASILKLVRQKFSVKESNHSIDLCSGLLKLKLFPVNNAWRL